MSTPITLMGILVDHRAEMAPEVQEIITRYGGDILCRMGIPSPSREKGLITVVMEAKGETVQQFRKELQDISGVDVQTMSFNQ